MQRLGGRPGPREVRETLVDGDIILRTDGQPYRGGVLYDLTFDTPGRFAQTLGAPTIALAAVHNVCGRFT